MSREYSGKKVVIWPAYIDASLTRSKGRKIPMKYAVKNPRIEELLEAARKLGLNPIVEEMAYPKFWWRYKERVIIDKVERKKDLLIKISTIIKEERERKRARRHTSISSKSM